VMPHVFRRLTLFLALILPLACRAEPDAALRVEGVAYTAEQVGRLTPEQLRVLADMTAFGLAASREELDALAEPLGERAGHRARANQLPWFLAARQLNLAESELRRAYEADPERELTVRHIVRLAPRWAAPEERQRARTVAEEARQRALAGEDFASLAGELSEEPGAAERGGRLQPGREGTWVDPFWRAALALEPGGISPMVETEYGYHVLRLDDRQPVPFEEADRAAVLRRAIPEAHASQAMEEWMIRNAAALEVDRHAAITARALLQVGEAPDTLVVARWRTDVGQTDGRYTAWDLALFRASLDGEQLERLDGTTEDGFVGRIENDAREAMWAHEAEQLGAASGEVAAGEARRAWQTHAVRWAQGLGFRAGMTDDEIRATALRALAARGQEARIIRMEIVGMRPLLWERYDVGGSALPSPTASSNSPTRNSEITG